MLHRSTFPLCFALLLPLAACSGEVVTQGSSGAGGANSATGSTTTTGPGGGAAGGAGGGSIETCPAEPPADGSPCDLPPDQVCTYGECCPIAYQCVNGAWLGIASPCVPPEACPANSPAEGSPCAGPCAQESPCVYICGEDLFDIVQCDADGAWHYSTNLCGMSIACGNTTCAAGEVCVEKAGGPGFSYECAPDTCAPAPLSCSCAGVLCGGSPYVCTDASGTQVSCVCPTCP